MPPFLFRAAVQCLDNGRSVGLKRATTMGRTTVGLFSSCSRRLDETIRRFRLQSISPAKADPSAEASIRTAAMSQTADPTDDLFSGSTITDQMLHGNEK